MILLGLGSNLGDRQANLEAALAALGHGENAPVKLLRVSSVYETAALLPEDAPEDWNIPYYNIAVAAESRMEPEELLEAAKAVERTMGRKDAGRWGPRVIDIDILAYDNRVLQSERLTLPHPAMLERDFVMIPLAEIQPHWRYPQEKDGESFSLREAVQRKGMTLGEGILRTSVMLRWPVE